MPPKRRKAATVSAPLAKKAKKGGAKGKEGTEDKDKKEKKDKNGGKKPEKSSPAEQTKTGVSKEGHFICKLLCCTFHFINLTMQDIT